jgi:molybdopterin-guanine dinucleotide biosynthesis protein A
MAETATLAAAAGGLLLAGGRSRRFGSEKAVAPFGARALMDSVALRFASLACFAISARPGSAAELRARELGVEVLYDASDAPSGPLAGVAAGLGWAQRHGLRFLATAPCDAPLLPSDLFEVLLSEIGEAPAAFARTLSSPHPLCAVWRVELLECLDHRLRESGHPAVRAFLAEIGAVPVPFDDPMAFANANTPTALAALEPPA